MSARPIAICPVAFLLLLLVGCVSNRTASRHPSDFNKDEDYYFTVIEIKSSLATQILDKNPAELLVVECDAKWTNSQIADWLALRFPKEVERAQLRLLKCHLNTIDPQSRFTKDLEERCWAEVGKIIDDQLYKTAAKVAKKASLSPTPTLQKMVADTILAKAS